MIERDDHHLFHDRVSWESRPESLSMRERLIARNMARVAHDQLHRETSPVPVPLVHSLQWVSRRFHDPSDPFKGIEDVSFLLEAANRLKYVKPIEVEINLLAIEALQAQIPYLQDGLPSTTTVIDLGHHHE